MKRPQFQLRELLFIMVIAALSVGWWVDRRRQQFVIDDLQADIREFKRLGYLEPDGDGEGDIEEFHEMVDSL
ncbi:MAG: hypothetical protein QGG36_24165 [Pirellulaceae bacterium]|nr:hypothetical protein [Pirellulaceae bacterium]MDP7018914.1 hypothetical protein [Pirellulaceae bacterium]